MNVRSRSLCPDIKPLLLGGAREELIARIVSQERIVLRSLLPLLGLQASGEESRCQIARSPNWENDSDDVSLSDSDGDSAEIDESEKCESGSEIDDSTATESETIIDGKALADSGPRELTLLKCCFGFERFRDAQKWAVDRSISGLSSLLVMPTGSGKSLCYQLPAMALNGLTIVISPLIALMQDQMKKLPACLPGACLSGPLTTLEMASITSDVFNGYIKVLFVSPERVCTNAFRHFMQRINACVQGTGNDDKTHAVSLLCVDEAHCMSSWSYNFRPAFLRIRNEIAYIKPRAILALTATAPPYVQEDIMMHLSLPKDGINVALYNRSNLTLRAHTVDSDEARRALVLELLKSELPTMSSTIVYVWRRYDAESYSDSFKSAGIKSAPYHAGMDSDSRKKTQQLFDRGTVDVITATTSFGMGVDKADVRRIFHCCLPKSIEAYLQETGRAGRDEESAICDLVVTSDDFIIQKSLAHSSRVSTLQIFLLLAKCFPVKLCRDTNGVELLQENTINRDFLERSLDLSNTMSETILSILELPPFCLLRVKDIYLDTVKGQLSDAVTGDEDVLIRAIKQCNRVRRLDLLQFCENRVYSTSGIDNVFGFGPQYDNGFSCSQAYLIDFDVSIFDLMRITSLDRDELTKGFFTLQKSAKVRHYSMQDHCFYTALLPSQNTKNSFEGTASYFEWLWNTAARVQERLMDIELREVNRVSDMWTLAKIIDSSSRSSKGNRGHDADIDVSFLIQQYMRGVNSQESVIIPAFKEFELKGAFSGSLIDEFHNKALLDHALTDARSLFCDVRLKDIVAGFTRQYVGQVGQNAINKVINVKEQMCFCKALYMARIMHGLVSPMIKANTWKETNIWGRYREIPFDQLIQSLLTSFSQFFYEHSN